MAHSDPRNTAKHATVDEVVAVVMQHHSPLAARRVPTTDALGLVLSSPVTARNNVPPFTNSAMDGYALQAMDLATDNVCLRVVDEIMAGDAPTQLRSGEAIRIMTGAPMPGGADTVVRIEDTTDEAGANVRIHKAVAHGANVRIAGEDIAAGAIALNARTLLGPAHLALLASVGATEVNVYPRPRIGVLSTGDELTTGAGDLRPGEIRDANRPALLALVCAAGCEAVDLGVVRDDKDAIAHAVASGLASVDALMTSGGVSAGDKDLVAAALLQLGGSVRSFHIEMRPGRPFSFATIDAKPVFGLSGNPAAAMIGFELFVRPAMRAMAGHQNVDRPRLTAIVDDEIARRRDGKVHFVRVAVSVGADRQLHVRSAGPQNPHLLTTSAAASGLVQLPDGVGVAVGDHVEVMVLDWDAVVQL